VKTNQIQIQIERIKRGTLELIDEKELAERLLESLKKKRPLRIKAGFDPTASDIHLGHTVLLSKLRTFQELGHKVILLIGDFTALIGDPSGQTKTRKILSRKEIKENALTYLDQVSKVLLRDKMLLEVRYNSEWFRARSGKKGGVDLEKFLEIASVYNVARIIERDDFSKRLKGGKPVSVLEFLYPLMQGYDSVALDADVELGGSDQKFNLLVGRDIQRAFNKRPQIVITLPLLEGLDGKQKMSKTLNNYIGITEVPRDIFGKVMSISDELMHRFYCLLTEEDLGKVKVLHPKQAKLNLAKIIVSRFYTEKEAEAACSNFESVFSAKNLPDDAPSYRLNKKGESILDILSQSQIAKSGNEARRLIKSGAVHFGHLPITDEKLIIKNPGILKIGKSRFLKLTLA